MSLGDWFRFGYEGMSSKGVTAADLCKFAREDCDSHASSEERRGDGGRALDAPELFEGADDDDFFVNNHSSENNRRRERIDVNSMPHSSSANPNEHLGYHARMFEDQRRDSTVRLIRSRNPCSSLSACLLATVPTRVEPAAASRRSVNRRQTGAAGAVVNLDNSDKAATEGTSSSINKNSVDSCHFSERAGAALCVVGGVGQQQQQQQSVILLFGGFRADPVCPRLTPLDDLVALKVSNQTVHSIPIHFEQQQQQEHQQRVFPAARYGASLVSLTPSMSLLLGGTSDTSLQYPGEPRFTNVLTDTPWVLVTAATTHPITARWQRVAPLHSHGHSSSTNAAAATDFCFGGAVLLRFFFDSSAETSDGGDMTSNFEVLRFGGFTGVLRDRQQTNENQRDNDDQEGNVDDDDDDRFAALVPTFCGDTTQIITISVPRSGLIFSQVRTFRCTGTPPSPRGGHSMVGIDTSNSNSSESTVVTHVIVFGGYGVVSAETQREQQKQQKDQRSRELQRLQEHKSRKIDFNFDGVADVSTSKEQREMHLREAEERAALGSTRVVQVQHKVKQKQQTENGADDDDDEDCCELYQGFDDDYDSNLFAADESVKQDLEEGARQEAAQHQLRESQQRDDIEIPTTATTTSASNCLDYLADCFLLDCRSKVWRRVDLGTCSDERIPRCFHSMVSVLNSQQLFVFGGEARDGRPVNVALRIEVSSCAASSTTSDDFLNPGVAPRLTLHKQQQLIGIDHIHHSVAARHGSMLTAAMVLPQFIGDGDDGDTLLLVGGNGWAADGQQRLLSIADKARSSTRLHQQRQQQQQEESLHHQHQVTCVKLASRNDHATNTSNVFTQLAARWLVSASLQMQLEH